MVFAPSFRLDGKTALVTGAGRGIGRGVALALAESGADVAVIARNQTEIDELVIEIRNLGKQAYGIVLDVTDTGAISSAVEEVERNLAAIDIFVNSAGTNIQNLALDVSEDEWDAVLSVNLKAAFFWSQAVARAMHARGSTGRMVHLASQIGAVGFQKRAAYAASKGGLVNMVKVLALEWAEAGIRVNCVGPTFVDTPLARAMLADSDIAAEVYRRIPIGRLGRVDEVAAAVIYLVSEGADLVTGHHLLVDGGWTAQ